MFICTVTYVCLWMPEANTGMFLNSFPPYSLKQGVSLEPGALVPASLTIELALVIPYHGLPKAGITGGLQGSPSIYIGSGNLNSYPQASHLHSKGQNGPNVQTRKRLTRLQRTFVL